MWQDGKRSCWGKLVDKKDIRRHVAVNSLAIENQTGTFYRISAKEDNRQEISWRL
jgi:hypothetical protein